MKPFRRKVGPGWWKASESKEGSQVCHWRAQRGARGAWVSEEPGRWQEWCGVGFRGQPGPETVGGGD